MKIRYIAGMSVSQTQKYSDQIEDLIDDEWRKKSAKLQERRWNRIHEKESGGRDIRYENFRRTH